MICEDFTLKRLLLFKICTCEICEQFVYKHSETIKPTFLKTSRANNSRIPRIKNVKFSGYCFILAQTYRDIFKSALVYL